MGESYSGIRVLADFIRDVTKYQQEPGSSEFLLKLKFNLTKILTQARLDQDCINMHMLCNINPKPWLTFPFEFSSMTHPIRFEVFPAWVSPHIQPISIKVLTLEHQSNLTPCQFDRRRHFNPNTMLDLKRL